MSSNNWEAIKPEYEAGERSLRDIAAEFGVSEGAIRKKAKALNWVRKEGTQKAKSTHSAPKKQNKVRTSAKVRTTSKKKDATPAISSEKAPEAKKPHGKRNFPPFGKGNTYGLKHSAYSRRMMLTDDVIEEAQKLTLADELFRLRAANLMASDTIGRLKVELEDDELSKEERAAKEGIIRGAEKGIGLNTVRIESIEHTMASIAKMGIDAQYRIHATEKVVAEIESMKGDNGVVATIVHNSLPIPR